MRVGGEGEIMGGGERCTRMRVGGEGEIMGGGEEVAGIVSEERKWCSFNLDRYIVYLKFILIL